MSNSIFHQYILGGGWAMLLLIPASIVAVATVFRGVAVLFSGDGRENAAELVTAERALLQPLVVVYTLAPVVGAIAAAWRGVALGGFTGEEISPAVFNAFIPLAWGVTIGFVALMGYALLRGRLMGIGNAMAAREGESMGEVGALTKSRWPSAWPAFIVIVVAAALCGAAMVQLKTDVVPALPNITLAPSTTGGAPATQIAGDTTVLEVRQGEYLLNDQAVAQGDLLFRLSALASRSPVIVIKISEDDIPANRLSEALLLVNQAGFTQIGLQ